MMIDVSLALIVVPNALFYPHVAGSMQLVKESVTEHIAELEETRRKLKSAETRCSEGQGKLNDIQRQLERVEFECEHNAGELRQARRVVLVL